jgi:integrase
MNRRAAGEGTIRLHKPSRLYEARYYVPGDPRYKSVYARTEREAANRRTERLAEIARGGYASGGRQRLADYSRRWLDEVAAVSVGPVTHEQYERILRLHVLPALGRIKLGDIRPGHVQSLYAAKAREGYSSRTLRYIQTTLGVVLKHAALVGEIPRNPAKGVPVPPQRPRGADDEEQHPDPLRVLDSGGVQSLLEAA